MSEMMEHHFPAGRSNHIMVFDNYLDPDVCDEAVELFKIHYPRLFTPGPTFSGVTPGTKLSQDAAIDPTTLGDLGLEGSALTVLRNQAEVAGHIAVQRYIQEYRTLWSWPGIGESGFRVQHYHRGHGFYRQHCDHLPWEGHPSHSSTARVLATITYLNTIEVGGATRLVEQEADVKPVTGRILVFPATWTHPHMGLLPISVDKWILSSFIHCDMEEYYEDFLPEQWITPLKDDVGVGEATELLKEELFTEEATEDAEEATEDE